MKRLLLFIALLFSSCSSGRYITHSDNLTFKVIHVQEISFESERYLVTLKTYYKRGDRYYSDILRIKTNAVFEVGQKVCMKKF